VNGHPLSHRERAVLITTRDLQKPAQKDVLQQNKYSIRFPEMNMADRNRKSSSIKPTAPVVGLYSSSEWVTRQLDQASRRLPRDIAREIVDTLSTEDLRRLPAETRHELKRKLTNGRISDSIRRAIEKLSVADLVEIEFQCRIVIQGPQDFVDRINIQLTTLSRLEIGRKLLRSLLLSQKRVAIVPTSRMSEAPPENFRAAIARGKILKWKDLRGNVKLIRGTGAGSNTTIKYNPDLIRPTKDKSWRKHPPEIGLAHELIHANDSAYGQLDPEEIEGVRNYERQAVGLPPFEEKEFTENKFREAWEEPLPPRTSY
jgi:hypothetical protein